MRCVVVLLLGLVVACSSEYPRETTCTVGDHRDCTCATGGPGFELCYDASPAIWGACVCDTTPIANAGVSGVYPYRTTVQLDGSMSNDPNHLPVQFQWTLDSQPAGSTTMLVGDNTYDPSLLLDVIGDYRISLVVSDGVETSAPAHINLTAQNDAPTVVASVTPIVNTGTAASLDASATTDDNADPLTFAWTIVGRPQGSTAVPADPTAATTTFVPDVDGDYLVRVTVSDGLTTNIVTDSLTSVHRMTALPGEVSAAMYDKAHDRIVAIPQSLNELFVYTVATDSFAIVPLSYTPLALAVSPDGTQAVVGDNANGIVVVNLTTMAVVNRFPETFTMSSIVAPGDGWAYVFTRGMNMDTPEVHGVRLSNGAVTLGPRLEFGMWAERMAGTTSIYATGGALTVALTYASGTTTLTRSSTSLGTRLTTTDDGTRFFVPGTAVYAADFTALAPLSRTQLGISESSTTGKLLAVPTSATDTTADESIDVYTYPALVYDHPAALPKRLRNGIAYNTHARFVFLHADGVHYSVLVEVDPLTNSPTEWAVINL